MTMGGHLARVAAQLSMDAVRGRAKDDWLALFTEDAVVEDPVGPSHFSPDGTGHRGRDASLVHVRVGKVLAFG